MAESVAKLGFGMLADIFFELLPEPAVIADFLAGGADRDQPAKHFDFPEGALEFLIAAAKLLFSFLPAIHFVLQCERRGHAGE